MIKVLLSLITITIIYGLLGGNKRNILSINLLTFLISTILIFKFDNSIEGFQFHETIFNIQFGIDGISLFFIILTTFITPMCLLIGWNAKNNKIYNILFLSIEICLIIVFSVLDFIYFYIFFEALLIPMFFIIAIYGSRDRKILAAYQLFIYTLVGSLFMLIGIFIIYFETGTFNIEYLINYSYSFNRQLLLWFLFFIAFAIKIPMMPFHLWLPEAHVEAPTGGSVLLAGILLKLGTYGLIRINIPMFHDASIYFSPLIYTLSTIGILYSSFTTIRHIDLKKIIAYSSIAHMNFVTLGLFSFNIYGINGALFLMFSHAFISSALFICIGLLYSRFKTRLISYYGGLASIMPLFSIIFLFLSFANMSFPGTASFIGESLILFGLFPVNFFITILASIGIILGAAYSIWLLNRLCFGYCFIYAWKDINRREFFILLPFLFFSLFLGIYPSPLLDSFSLSIFLHT